MDVARQGEAVHVCHLHVEQGGVERLAIGGAEYFECFLPEAAEVSLTCQLAGWRSRSSRLVALSSTTRTCVPASSVSRWTTLAVSGRSAICVVNQKVEPWPG